jgi:hypothetical protein
MCIKMVQSSKLRSSKILHKRRSKSAILPKTLKNYPNGDWKRAMQKKIFFKNFNCRTWIDISKGIYEFFFGIFDRIDFEIKVFEGRRQCYFRPCMAGLAAFDSRLRQFIEVLKPNLLEIHNVWHVRYLWKKS